MVSTSSPLDFQSLVDMYTMAAAVISVEKKDEGRYGGDEFVIIVQDCNQEEFNKKVSSLREESKYGSKVCFAIGAHWNEGNKDLRLCMHLADEAMYADKKNFYQLHPEKAR